ncbi:hypothetical protein [uncultured Maritimibacter sp.]|jgi:hypothetical protein|uniref:hypothetical protein n=1 Tax=uncultured Maritimibacter sp. TaxID=991866 RepID=UPI0026320D58|nr:hypothetical protein [uncultured Maritimibacter sp.]
MKALMILFPVLALTACDMAGRDAGDLPPRFQVAEAPITPEAMAAFPADLPTSDMLVQVDRNGVGFCYFYRRDGKIYPLTNAQGSNVCVQ